AARPVRYLGIELLVRHLPNDPQRRVDIALKPLDQLRRRQDRAGLLVQLQEVDDLGDVLREDELVAARQYGNRARTEPLQLGPPGAQPHAEAVSAMPAALAAFRQRRAFCGGARPALVLARLVALVGIDMPFLGRLARPAGRVLPLLDSCHADPPRFSLCPETR